jgi:hypothetical protein
LRSVPTKDWTDADARAWWKKFRDVEQQVRSAPDAQTITMTIDLDAKRVASTDVKSA